MNRMPFMYFIFGKRFCTGCRGWGNCIKPVDKVDRVDRVDKGGKLK
jgi:hypothetical protein